MPKPFLSFDAQINHLEHTKNLTIPDHDYAKKMLQQIGYFGLIGGYKTPFKNLKALLVGYQSIYAFSRAY